MKHYYVYILASRKNGTIYIGLTNNLLRRVYEHKNDLIAGFTKKYRVHQLAHFEIFEDVNSAIQREKQLKVWKRQWKLELIEKQNPGWKDLYQDLLDSGFQLSLE
jgi:putative endonuclease